MLRVKIPDNATIYDIFKTQVYLGWDKLFATLDEEIKDLSETMDNVEKEEGKFFPHKEDIFNAFIYTNFNNLKVVIIGQDPYPGVNDYGDPVACGLAFSTRKSDDIQASLQNIYKKIRQEYPDSFKMPTHGDLTYWCQQGVLLLNSALTYPVNQNTKRKKNHTPIWRGFVEYVLHYIREHKPNVCFVLWGNFAKDNFGRLLEKAKRFEGAHPSPFSFHMFIQDNYFGPINDYLLSINEQPIDWNVY